MKRDFIGLLAEKLSLRAMIAGIILCFMLGSIIFPFFWMLSSSFKTYAEIGSPKPVYLPSSFNLSAFRELFDPSFKGYQHFGRNLWNTVQLAVPTTLIATILSLFGAYAIARFRMRYKSLFLKLILLIYLFPAVLLIIPLFAMLSNIASVLHFRVVDNLWVLLLTYLSQTLPVALYMLSNYFKTIPNEIEEAAAIDGLGRFMIIIRISLPLALPAIISVAIYVFMIAWNEYLYALIFLNSNEALTMPIKISSIYNAPTPRPHVVMAASSIITLPIIILFLSMERYMNQGLTAGGVKG